MAALADWIGRTRSSRDVLRGQPARFMAAMLDRDQAFEQGEALPPLWHWLYFHEAARASALGRDGHPKRGDFLPPVALPRRMWAGGRFEFHAPMRIGAEVDKHSTVTQITEKQGRSGPLCFVTVRHEFRDGDTLCLSEEHDIVYREDPAPDAPVPPVTPAPTDGGFGEEIQPTEVLLFRYSALMYNGHRIHYDVDYARKVEGYDGLVFHGPLTATLLVDLALRQKGRPPKAFSFRGMAPISGMAPFRIEGRQSGNEMSLWARRADGALAMRAEARF